MDLWRGGGWQGLGFLLLIASFLVCACSSDRADLELLADDEDSDSADDPDDSTDDTDDDTDDSADDSDDDETEGSASLTAFRVACEIPQRSPGRLQCDETTNRCYYEDQEEGVVCWCSLTDGTVFCPIQDQCRGVSLTLNSSRGCFTAASLDCPDWGTIYCFSLADASESITPTSLAQHRGTPIIALDEEYLYHSVAASPSGDVSRFSLGEGTSGVVCEGMELPTSVVLGPSHVAFSYGQNDHDQLGVCPLGLETSFVPLGTKGAGFRSMVLDETYLYALEGETPGGDDGRILRIPLQGGSGDEIVSGLAWCNGGMIVSDGFVTYCESLGPDLVGGIFKVSPEGGTPTSVVSVEAMRSAGTSGSIEQMTTMGDFLYMIVGDGDGGYVIARVGK